MPKQNSQNTKPAKTSPVIGGLRRRPVGVGEVLLHDAEQIEHADDDQTRLVSLNRPMKVLTMPGMTSFSACGRTIRPIFCQ